MNIDTPFLLIVTLITIAVIVWFTSFRLKELSRFGIGAVLCAVLEAIILFIVLAGLWAAWALVSLGAGRML